MATLAELNTLLNDSTLSEKVGAACLVAAKNVKFEGDEVPNHTNRLKWAAKVFADPVGQRLKVMRYVVAANSSLSLASITGLSDTDIQNHTDAAIVLFADGN